ncbi:cag pathogenicity island protein [Helicobacter pylori]|nr:cag pathogenicity island protein [Helicobacter pylori]
MPHNATMGRDKILQQTRLKFLSLNIKTKLRI